MQSVRIIVDNLKCGGCEHSIKRRLLLEDRVKNVDIEIENSLVIIKGKALNENHFIDILTSMGYPPKGSTNLLQSVKSYVSCAIGKWSKS